MKKNVRKIQIFCIGLNVLAWLAWVFGTQTGAPEAGDLGLLIWLVAPLLMAVLLRLFNKDWADTGIGPKLFGNLKWYLASLFVFPVIITIVLAAGNIFGGISLDNFNIRAFLNAAAAILQFNLIKNVIEEMAWRGYMTPKVNAVVKKPVWGHLLVGLFWGIWHIPYYLGLLDLTILTGYTSLDIFVFIPLVILGMMVAGILFGELRLITGSIWPGVLMHTVSNVCILTLLLEGFIEVPRQSILLFSPSWEGIITMALMLGIGLYLKKIRIKEK